jgi:polysaccharide deacetylase 2 family uncharacterized protein YibQ
MVDIYKLFKVIIISGICLGVAVFLFREKDYTQETVTLDTYIKDILEKERITESDILYKKHEIYKHGRYLFLKIESRYKVKAEFDPDDFLAKVKQYLSNSKFSLARFVTEKEGNDTSFLISFSFKNRVLYKVKFLKKANCHSRVKESTGAKIAIVLDDWGYNTSNLETLFAINLPLTISILPNLPYSEKIANEAINHHNIEVMLHLPLEPYGENVELEDDTIMTTMSPEEVNNLLTKAIKSVPGLKGVSNHMGSRATEDPDFMKKLFKEFRKRNLYFLDNLVTDKSICGEVAGILGIQTAARSVFLDNKSEERYIEKQILHTAELAAKTGWAVGVGHDRINTLKVITKVIPQLKEAGFEFVNVSELVK